MDQLNLEKKGIPTVTIATSAFEELVKSTDAKWRGPYLSKQTIPKDPWGQDYQYKTPGDHGPFDIYSLGASGKLDENSAKNW